MYFWGWPVIRDKIWPPPERIIGPMLPPEPVPWSVWLIKIAAWSLICVVMLLLYIYFKQESILYVPMQPIQFIEQNPPRYQSPAERDMKHEEVWLTAKDGTKLQAWFLYQ